jgi:hypothetical protein
LRYYIKDVVLVGKPEQYEPLVRWEDRTKMDLKEPECETVDWIHLASSRAGIFLS